MKIKPIDKTMSRVLYDWMTYTLQRRVAPTLIPDHIDFSSDEILSGFAKVQSELALAQNQADLTMGSYPNACAYKSETGQYRICLTPELLLSLYEAALLYAAWLELDETALVGTAMPMRIRNGAFYDFEYLLGRNSLCVSDLETSPPDVPDVSIFFSNSPKQKRYKEMADLLFDFALAWVSLHERAHILLGHVDYERSLTKDTSFAVLYEAPTPESAQWRISDQRCLHRVCMEMHADTQAALDLISRNTQPSIWLLYEKSPHPTSREEIIILSVAMMLVTMAILKKIETLKGPDPRYPTVEERIAYTVLQLADIYRDDWMSVMKGCVQAKWYFDRSNGLLPSFSFSQQNGFTAVNSHRIRELKSVLYKLWPTLSDAVDRAFRSH